MKHENSGFKASSFSSLIVSLPQVLELNHTDTEMQPSKLRTVLSFARRVKIGAKVVSKHTQNTFERSESEYE